MIRKSLAFFFLCFSLTAVFAQTTYYVKTNGNDDAPNDGTSWSTAFKTLQKALEIAQENDRIYMASGIYTPSSFLGINKNNYDLGPRDFTFLINKTIYIYGGFKEDGSENSPEERKTSNDPTILSGDLNGDGIASAEDVYHVVVVVGGENNSIQPLLDGLTITGGYTGIGAIANDKSTINGVDINVVFGAGIHNNKNAQTRLNDVTLIGNKALSLGGGVYIQDSSPVLTDVLIEKNSADYGGGITSLNSSSVLNNVILTGNNANFGGGIYMDDNSDLQLTAVIVQENIADWYGGGIYCKSSSPILTNVLIKGNNSYTFGSGIHNYNSSPILTNVTLTGNRSDVLAGGIYNNNHSSPDIRNSIIWGNKDADIYNSDHPETVVCSYSLIGGSGGSGN